MGAYDYDVIVAGAGPGGCVAAMKLAQAGHRVGLFDSMEAENLGKPIIIEAERTVFPAVGVDMPSGDMVPYHPEAMRYISPKGKTVFRLEDPYNRLPIALFQDRYVRGLLRKAVRSGVIFNGGCRVLSPLLENGAVCGINVATSKGESEVRAKITIDATGFSATLTRALPDEHGFDFPEEERHIVSAENSWHETVPEKAKEAVANGIHADNEVLTRLGGFGSYSTVFSYLSAKRNRAYVLVGLKKSYEKNIPARQVLQNFINDSGWFGKKLHGGAGHIRIRHQLDRLISKGFMAVGEAACMVFPMHGSGLASALYAGMLSAKAASAALDANDFSERALWPYAAEYQLTRGYKFAAYSVTRLTIDTFTEENVADMMESGIMHPDDLKNGLMINEPVISPSSLPERILGMARHPSFIPLMAKMGIRLNAVLSHYKKYPIRYDREEFAKWREISRQLFRPIGG
jgi:flavin-dependent dehydrogenase